MQPSPKMRVRVENAALEKLILQEVRLKNQQVIAAQETGARIDQLVNVAGFQVGAAKPVVGVDIETNTVWLEIPDAPPTGEEPSNGVV